LEKFLSRDDLFLVNIEKNAEDRLATRSIIEYEYQESMKKVIGLRWGG
jgi:hypothetical protein